ncbi:MAG TPA: LysR family transcriptional regulator [Candidatus Merdivicinus intestinavium]|nr:LysR family transcriptional regulator [Candidatus Merdivicinus intestinavium]
MYNPQLETFLCVAESGSFNRAAEKLYISPPAVIKQINLLEEGLDLQLFVRTHRGLALTEAGKSLYQDAKYIIQYCKDSVTRAKNAMQESENMLRIGTSPMTPAQVLVDLWPRVQEYCPNIKFQLVPFDNTPENAREILANLGRNIDVVAGIFDETMLSLRQCAGLEISREPICCAVSVHHRLAGKERLTIQDLYGENLMLMRRDWSHYVDLLRDGLWKNHPQIHIVDFSFYDVNVFNQCENNNYVLMAIENWRYVHPLLKILPVDWNYTLPFGLLHSPEPSPIVRQFLKAVEKVAGCRGKVRG